MVFGQNRKILTSAKKGIPSERASLEEQNGTNFSFIAPSSEELGCVKNFSANKDYLKVTFNSGY